jgi:hypothetical protein
MKKLLTKRIYLNRKLYGLFNKIIDHLNVFNTLICRLESIDVKIDEEVSHQMV